MSDELRPCPFCGGEAKTEVDTDGSIYVEVSHEPWCYLSADDTRCWFYAEDGMTAEEVAARAWNRRAERTCHLIHEVEEEDDEFFDTVELHYYVCSECGWNNRPDAYYCDSCGAKVVER